MAAPSSAGRHGRRKGPRFAPGSTAPAPKSSRAAAPALCWGRIRLGPLAAPKNSARPFRAPGPAAPVAPGAKPRFRSQPRIAPRCRAVQRNPASFPSPGSGSSAPTAPQDRRTRLGGVKRRPLAVPCHRHIGQMPVHRLRGQHEGAIDRRPLRFMDRRRIAMIDGGIIRHGDGDAPPLPFFPGSRLIQPRRQPPVLDASTVPIMPFFTPRSRLFSRAMIRSPGANFRSPLLVA